MTTEIPPAGQDPILRVMPMPSDTNAAGDIFGGWIMSQVDLAGAILAARRAKGRVATVAVNAFSFKKPVYVSDVVSFYGSIAKIGTTSITVEVKVYAQRGWRRSTDVGEIVLVTDALLTYVAIDERGNKRPVPAES